MLNDNRIKILNDKNEINKEFNLLIEVMKFLDEKCSPDYDINIKK